MVSIDISLELRQSSTFAVMKVYAMCVCCPTLASGHSRDSGPEVLDAGRQVVVLGCAWMLNDGKRRGQDVAHNKAAWYCESNN